MAVKHQKDTLSPRRKAFIGVVIVAVVAAGGYLWWRDSQPTANTYHPKATEGKATLPTASASPSANGGGKTPADTTIPTSSAPQTSSDNKISITSPTMGSTLSDGTTVAGTVTTSATILYYRLKGGLSGQVSSGQIGITPGTDAAYSFTIGFTNQVSPGDQGELEVYTLKSNGSIDSVASVAVNIKD